MSKEDAPLELENFEPIVYDNAGSNPRGEKFFSSYNIDWDREDNFHETFMPDSVPNALQAFVMDYLVDHDLDILNSSERAYFLLFINENSGVESISRGSNVSRDRVRSDIQNAIEKLYNNLPIDQRNNYELVDLKKHRKSIRQKKNKTTSSGNYPYTASFEGGFGITELSQEESDRILKERREEEERKQKRLAELLESARDMDEDEREKDPDTGAIFNITLGSRKIPNDLSQIFKDHPDLEVRNDRWQGIHTSVLGTPYITYCNGDFCYVKNGTRTPLSPDYIKRLYSWEDKTSDSETIVRFGSLMFVRILDDIVETAEKAGFKPAITAS